MKAVVLAVVASAVSAVLFHAEEGQTIRAHLVFQMTLKPGIYKAYATVLNGANKRMEVNLSVR